MHIRRPRVDHTFPVVGLDRNEVGALLVTAGLSSPRDHTLVSLTALNGLHASEVVGGDIDNLGLERDHRTLTMLRKGGETVTMPVVAADLARAVDLAIGEPPAHLPSATHMTQTRTRTPECQPPARPA